MTRPSGDLSGQSPVLGDPAAWLGDPQATHPANASLLARAAHGLQRQSGNRRTGEVIERIRAEQDAGHPLDPNTRTDMEEAFGWGFGNVRVHTGAAADVLAGRMHAKAFVYGEHVFMRSDLPNFGWPEGKRILAHELAHVIQQERVADETGVPTPVTRDALEAEAGNAAEAASRGAPATVALRVRLPQISCIDGDEEDSVIRWMMPEAVFVEDFTRADSPEPIQASHIAQASVMRRFDQFTNHVDPFVAAYNFWTIPASLFWASMGRMQQLLESWAVSPDPSQLTADDRQVLSLVGLSAETRSQVTASAAEASRGPSVTEQLQRLNRSYYQLEAAKRDLEQARSRLIQLRLQKEREELADEVTQINQRIRQISEIIQLVGNLALTIGSAGAGAAAGSGRASQAATTFGSGVTQPGAQASAGSALRSLISLAYADQLSTLRTRISALKDQIQDAQFDAARAGVEAAESRLTVQNIRLREAATALRSALEQRRNVYASLGTRFDAAAAERGRREGAETTEGWTRYQAVFQIAAAVREAANTGMAALQATGANGIIGMVQATQAGQDLGPPGFSPTRPDSGQIVVGDALSRCIGFARWAQAHLPQLLVWAEGWTQAFAQIGRSGPSAPPVVEHETY